MVVSQDIFIVTCRRNTAQFTIISNFKLVTPWNPSSASNALQPSARSLWWPDSVLDYLCVLKFDCHFVAIVTCATNWLRRCIWVFQQGAVCTNDDNWPLLMPIRTRCLSMLPGDPSLLEMRDVVILTPSSTLAMAKCGGASGHRDQSTVNRCWATAYDLHG